MPRLDDGFSTLVTFANFPSVEFYEKGVTPPSVEGGGENDTTTMQNTAWRTRAPKKLKTLGEMGLTVAYAPEAYSDVVSMVNVNQLITVTFSDGGTLVFWGWLDSFVPGEIVEGEQPEAEVNIIASNQNASGAETAPTLTPGTTTT